MGFPIGEHRLLDHDTSDTPHPGQGMGDPTLGYRIHGGHRLRT
jgi:hypothetical protein